MKKILIIIGILILLAGTGAAYYYFGPREFVAEDLLPQGAIFYTRTDKAVKLFEGFKSSKFWKALDAIDFKPVLDKSGADPSAMSGILAVKHIINNPETLTFLDRFFGEHVALAIYPPDVYRLNTQPAIEVLSNIFVITRVKPETQFLDFAVGLLSAVDREALTNTSEYKGKKITLIDLSGFGFFDLQLAYIRLNDYIVFGMGEKAVKHCIDVFRREEPALSQDPNFLFARENYLADADTVSYVDLEEASGRFRDMVLRSIKKQGGGDPDIFERVDKTFERMQGLKVLGFSADFDETAHINGDFLFNREELHPDSRKIYECPATSNRTLHFVPREAMYYQWFNCNDLLTNWKDMIEELEKNPEFTRRKGTTAEKVDQIERLFNIDVEEDVLAPFGHEIAWYLEDVVVEAGFLPFPNGAVILSVQDKEKAHQLVARLYQQQFIRVETENHEAVPIAIATLPLGFGYRPAVSIVDQYLVVATDVLVLKQAIDSLKDPDQSLAANERLNRLDVDFQSPSNAFIYFDIRKMTGTIIKGMEWNFNWQIQKFKQQQAYMLGMKQRLADFRINIEQMRKDLKSSKEEIIALRIERKKKEVYKEDVSAVSQRIANLEPFIQKLEGDLNAATVKEAEQTTRVKELTKEGESLDPYRFEFYMNNFFKPLLKVLDAIDIIDSRSEFSDNNVQTEVFFKF